MCVAKCECNACLKKHTCTDCYHMDWSKNVNCSKDGVQGCEHYQYFYDAAKDIKKESW